MAGNVNLKEKKPLRIEKSRNIHGSEFHLKGVCP
jgi:hypothetical protein